jgi:hypothetical protein
MRASSCSAAGSWKGRTGVAVRDPGGQLLERYDESQQYVMVFYVNLLGFITYC